MSETEIVGAILRALHTIGVLCWRNNTGARGRLRFGLGNGSPEIVAVEPVTGRMVGLEVKTETGQPSDAQLAWGRALVASGGRYRIVRSVVDAVAVFAKPIDEVEKRPFRG